MYLGAYIFSNKKLLNYEHILVEKKSLLLQPFLNWF